MTRPQAPSWGARVRVLGHLALWLLEGGAQIFQLAAFLCVRGRVRRRFHALILEGRAPASESHGNGDC